MQVITTDQVLRQLLGISAVLAQLDQGQVQQLASDAIDAAQAEFEEESKLLLWMRTIKTFPGSTDVFDPAGTLGGTYNIRGTQFDFYKSGFRSMGYFQLPYRPLVVTRDSTGAINNIGVSVQYGPNQNLIAYPAAWIRPQEDVATIAIVPYAGAFGGVISGNLQPEFWLPLLAGGWMNDVVPCVVTIDYQAGIRVGSVTAGVPDVMIDPKWAELRMGLARMAALWIREGLNELIPASGSLDGVSTTFQSAQGMWDRLQNKVAEFKDRYIRMETPMHMSIV